MIYKIKWSLWKLGIKIKMIIYKKWIEKFETGAKQRNIDLSNWSGFDKLKIAIKMKQINKVFSSKKWTATP